MVSSLRLRISTSTVTPTVLRLVVAINTSYVLPRKTYHVYS